MDVEIRKTKAERDKVISQSETDDKEFNEKSEEFN